MPRLNRGPLLAQPSHVTVSSAPIARAVDVVATLTKSKALSISWPGTYQIRWMFTSTAAGGVAASALQGQIYKNGAVFGALRHASSSNANEEIIETLGPWERGDSCELWVAYNAGIGTRTVSLFRVMGSYQNSSVPIPAGGILTDVAV